MSDVTNPHPVAPGPARPPEDEEGLIGGGLRKLFGRSWKTTVTGLITIACGVVPLVPGVPDNIAKIAAVLLPIVAGGGLLVAKDGNVSGTRANPRN